MVNTINEARTPGELAAWLRQWADGADASDHLDDNDARQLAEAIERVCAPGNAAKVREALEWAAQFVEIGVDDERGADGQNILTAAKMARDALAAPARNCDRFEDGPDALDAYRGTLRDGEEVRVPWLLDWLFEPAKGGAK